MDSRLILHIGSQVYLLPDDVEPSAMVTTLRGMKEVTAKGYTNPKYQVGKVARLQFEIVDESDILPEPIQPPAPAQAEQPPVASADDEPF